VHIKCSKFANFEGLIFNVLHHAARIIIITIQVHYQVAYTFMTWLPKWYSIFDINFSISLSSHTRLNTAHVQSKETDVREKKQLGVFHHWWNCWNSMKQNMLWRRDLNRDLKAEVHRKLLVVMSVKVMKVTVVDGYICKWL